MQRSSSDDIDNLIDFQAENYIKELVLVESDETTAQVSVKPFSMDNLKLGDYDPSENFSSSEQSNKSDHSKKSLPDVEATHDTAEVITDQEKMHLLTQNQEGHVRKAGYIPARTGDHIPDHTNDASVPKDDHQINLDYYKLFYRNQPPATQPPHKASIWVNKTEFMKMWEYPIHSAMLTVNNAAPGLSLVFTKEFENSDIMIHEGNYTSTVDSILNSESNNKAKISLAVPGVGEILEQTALHQLMHALGFEHEHQRKDSELYIRHNPNMSDEDWKSMGCLPNITPVTPYDHYSIMHYTVCPENNLKYLENRTVPHGDMNTQLSELDKVALNICYLPCTTQSYSPRKHRNGMYYCGRPVMSNHNYPERSSSIACLQTGPNCPACRVLSRPTHMKKNQWQGWSGWVYCDNNECGPHCGRPCDNCRKVVTL